MCVLFTDFHCHCLPAMDDGAKDAAVSIGILDALKRQGVERVVATPHFYCHHESPQSFLERRALSFECLQQAAPVLPLPLLPGAEVRLERGLSENPQLPALSLAGSPLILLELPYEPFRPWMPEEICNIAYGFSLVPVIAHINRYLDWYSEEELFQILAIPDAVFQLNNEALLSRASLRFVLRLVKEGFPLVFGSDSHNLANRSPDFHAHKALRAKLGKSNYDGLVSRGCSLL